MSERGLASVGNISGSFSGTANASSSSKGQSKVGSNNYSSPPTSSTDSYNVINVSASFSTQTSQSAALTQSNINEGFTLTVQNELALRNEKSQVLYSAQKNWEFERRKLANKAHPEPTNDLGLVRNRNINREYQDRLNNHRTYQQNTEVRFNQQISQTRTKGTTMTDHFDKSSARFKYERPVIRKSHQSKNKARKR